MNVIRPQLIVVIIAIAIQCSNVMADHTFQSTLRMQPQAQAPAVKEMRSNDGESKIDISSTANNVPSSMADKGGLAPTPTLQPTPAPKEQSFVVETKEDFQQGYIPTAASSTNSPTNNEVDVSSYNRSERSCLEKNPNTTSRDEFDVLSLSNCQADLAIAIANSTATEEKLWKMEKEYVRVLNETYTELDKLEELVQSKTRQVVTWEERYKNTQKKLLEANAELSFMHSAATSSWVNHTQIGIDAINSVKWTFKKGLRWSGVDRRWNRYYRSNLRPLMQDAKRSWNRIYRKTNASLKPTITKMHDKWNHSTIRRRTNDSLSMVVGKARDAYRPLEPTVEETKIACRLSVVSAIEESSKTILYYLEKEERMKQERGDKSPTALQRQLEYKRRNRRGEKMKQHQFKREVNVEPSAVNLKARKVFKYTLANSEKLYEDGVALLPLVVGLSIARCGMIGSIFLFLGVPTSFICALAFVKLIICKMRRMK